MARRERSDTGATPAVRVLNEAGVTFREHHYTHDPAAGSYGMEAATELGLDPRSVFKTLVVQTQVSGPRGLAVAVLPVDRSLNLKSAAVALGTKRVELADPASAERVTGYVLGGVSPLGQKRALPTVIDRSAQHLATMFVSGGRRGFDLELAPADLAALTGASFAELVD